MSERTDKELGRRGFLVRVSAATAVGVGAGTGWALWRRARARFEATDGFPDMPTSVRIEVPEMGASERLEVAATLTVDTPREQLTRELGVVTVVGGEGALDVALTYPYEEIVPGAYTYRVELRGGGLTIATGAPARYRVRPMTWLS